MFMWYVHVSMFPRVWGVQVCVGGCRDQWLPLLSHLIALPLFTQAE